ncbi:hypothetical protein M948_07285 [Virgibacillus sp. CM-4]|uniref:DUF2254 domain-containing protein n=1 Tax=Virgibacillus massiliensis TaxID=1462526 RepID=A0A024Q7C4_9BACI|nr:MULTISPECIES: DUF2254 domain-containing protein [Virgibacillus]EQB38375.1 hypothetical protein M948_07285 [Virgibacillus sp. CM-4]CDQ38115.1 hypothetical protein BN990_00382 [Virgibacillus massiliensis]
MLVKLLPPSISKYLQMSKPERQYELRLTLWWTPLLYVIVTFLFAAITLYLDVGIGLAQYMPVFFKAEFETTRLLISSLIGGVLTLSAFTLNSLLVVLTTFSGQFSPRLLQNFVKDKQTQHILGVFNGSFVYVLIMFLFISSKPVDYYTAVPFVTVLIAFFAAIVFIYFINHATTWMQVHNITDMMNDVSEGILNGVFSQELEEIRTSQPGDMLEHDYPQSKTVMSPKSGYIQLILFKDLIKEARKDNIIIKMEVRVGSFVLNGNQLFTYWGPGADNVDEAKYVQLIRIGHKETEIQDLKFGLNKLGEIAIKAIGNDDPKTASNTIFQVTDLLLTLEKNVTFSPYLVDEYKQVRLILGVDNFEYHLYQGLGVIRHYAQKNYPIITDIIAALTRLAGAVDEKHHDVIWGFASNTIDHIYTEFIFDIDRRLLLRNLYKLAEITGNFENYHYIEQHFKGYAQ